MDEYISLQKYAEQQMRFKASIVQSLWDALIVTDLQYTILDWNAAAEALYGWKKAEVLGKDVRSIVSTVFPGDLREEWDRQLRSRGYWQGELLQKRKDGTTVPILAAVSLVKDLEGNNIGIVAVNRDMTERRELEQRKDGFISVASHELKTPLTTIQGMAQLLRKKLAREGRDDLLALISVMEQQIKSMTRLTTELLDVAKMQAGQVDYAQVLVDMDALVYDVVEILQQTTSSHTLYLHGASRKSVVGDPERLMQVLINLISNAIKYSPDADRVEIFLSADDSQVVIAVQDDGVGIPQEEQGKIFDRFYRADNADGKTVPGFGLGLYIADEILKQHGGMITVESEEGKGATFYMTLPCAR
ncbi:MAG TPA: ATP-binding protein [Ktedonobacteraceae bacterium]